ncbi:hypothetical protein [uncultured Herbaspirillum sp.]|uniref:hypothetical protein n=1 Tax=uncultured Herbaspirillum sp. TaxID=160236 RepID=UPI00258F7D1C|nr:hypothetical protein [uncultured Herbaspirillum sp.]
MHYLDTSYVQQGQEHACRSGGVLPAPLFVRSGQRYPMLRYPWSQVRQSLLALAQSRPGGEAVQPAFSSSPMRVPCIASWGLTKYATRIEAATFPGPAGRRQAAFLSI